MRAMLLTRRGLLRAIDQQRVQQAIREAERQTSGELRVSVSRFFWGDVRKVADRAFGRLGMTATAQRNGILFFIVPSRRRFVVLGDKGIHAKVGQDFWNDLTAAISAEFKKGRFQEGLLNGIAEAGARLGAAFPYNPATDKNELPDDIDIT